VSQQRSPRPSARTLDEAGAIPVDVVLSRPAGLNARSRLGRRAGAGQPAGTTDLSVRARADNRRCHHRGSRRVHLPARGQEAPAAILVPEEGSLASSERSSADVPIITSVVIRGRTPRFPP
jgi:hypothetical protein